MECMTEEIFINDTFVRNVKSISNVDKNAKDINDHKRKTEPITVDSIIRTKDFMKIFNSSMNQELELIPDNCRYMKNLSDKSKIFVLEDEPRLRTVSFNFDPTVMLEILKQNGKYDTFNLSEFKTSIPFKLTLSIPYVVYILHLRNGGGFDLLLFYRLAPISSMDDYLLEPCLPNISDQYQVCLGPISTKNDSNINSVNSKIRKIIDSFWFNSFNYDYFLHCDRYKEVPELSDLFTYSFNSKKDPMFIFSTKWFNTGYTLNEIIKKQTKDYNFHEFSDIFEYFQKSIEKSSNSLESQDENYLIEKRSLSESICLSNDCIISIGDKIELDEIKYYINSFKYDPYGELRYIVLEDENNNIVEKEMDANFSKQIQNQFKNKEINSIVIGDEILREGDIVYFNNNENVKLIEKIIQTRDGMNHIKIGKEFYLESSFLNKTLKKFKGELEFGGTKLILDNEYIFISSHDSRKSICFSKFKGIFKGHSFKDGRIILKFQQENNKNLFLTFADSKVYKIIDRTLLKSSPEIFRIYDQISTEKLCYIDKFGFCDFESKTNLSDLRSREYLYNSSIGIKYFTDFCNNKNQELNIKSFDHDIIYKIGDSVIFINWNEPETMLKIQTITNFIIEDDYFKLTLEDNSGNSKNVSLINLITGQGEFASIRQVCNQINEMKVGMKMQPIKKGIQDFPMKDNFEIKAFVVDSKYPLVLFSNGRTLYFEDMMQNFVIVNSKSKRALKPSAEFNLNIKMQDGDIFKYSDDMIQLVYSSNFNRMYSYTLSSSGYYSYKIRDFGTYMRSYVKSKISSRIGLLKPRISDQKMRELRTEKGFPSIFSEIFHNIEDIGYGIREDLSFLKNDSEVEEAK